MGKNKKTDKMRAQFFLTKEEHERLLKYATKRRYKSIGDLALFTLERYMRQYPDDEGE